MKKQIFLVIILITFFSCKKNEFIEGEIYITLINFYNAKNIVPKEDFAKFKKGIINFDEKGKTNSEKKMRTYYKTLIDNNLFDKSNFQIKLKNKEIINVYINDEEYLKLKKELKTLDRDKEKIKIKFEGSKISNGVYNRAIYSASSIVSIEKTAGKTDWHK